MTINTGMIEFTKTEMDGLFKTQAILAEESLKERAWAAGKVDPAV